jgi:hypothetical protein
MPNYDVVFDVTREWPDLRLPAVGLLLLAAAVVLWRYRRKPLMGWPGAGLAAPGARALLLGVLMAFSALWTLGVGGYVLGTYAVAVWDLHTGNVRVVEGPVQSFQPESISGHGMETFRVQGVRFEYSADQYTPGFHRSHRDGGPMRGDVQARIHYSIRGTDPAILRLEIAE